VIVRDFANCDFADFTSCGSGDTVASDPFVNDGVVISDYDVVYDCAVFVKDID
jgi:hypothetical protein